ncbi:LysR family transcriptional regulator [Devosia sp. A369]
MNLNNMDLNLLRVFDALMRELSVTRAASRIGRTQSAVSHSLSKLRRIFDDELFLKDNGRLRPTLRAQQVAVVVTSVLSELQAVVEGGRSFEPLQSTRNFRIGLTDYTGVAFLPLLVQMFADEAPNATLNILHAKEAEVPVRMRAREFECAILGNPTIDEPGIVGVDLGVDRMVCAGWRGNPDLKDMTVEKYVSLPHLQISADGAAPGVADTVLADMNLTRRVVVTEPHYLVAPWILKGSRLVTAFGESVLFAISDASETLVVRPPIPFPDVILKMLYEGYLETDPAHRWLRALVRRVADQQRTQKEVLYEKLLTAG